MVNGPGTDNLGFGIQGSVRRWQDAFLAQHHGGFSRFNGNRNPSGGTLGYEWDVDPDNWSRPAGLFDLSTATYKLTTDLLLDYGATYGAGVATHHMTMHRAPSGALVFGAGTVQWSWGLDSNHDNAQGFTTPAASKDMQQATVNLFADMGVQPATMQSTLKAATMSTDTTPPKSSITSPASGALVTLNSSVTISGTATDTGGGVVGGVAVSFDGGQTWHPATGRGTWTYTFKPSSYGPTILKSRAVDDSGNIETPGAGVSVYVPGPYTLTGTITPTAAGSGATVTLIGPYSTTVTANSSGVYTFTGLIAGSYSVAATHTGYLFNPAATVVAVNNASVSGVNFAATQASGGTYSISGSVTPAVSGITITLSGASTGTTLTTASGTFSFSGLGNGSYTLTPSSAGVSFSPTQSTTTISGANITGITFSSTSTSQTLFTTQTPGSLDQSDGAKVNYELGTLLQSSVPGQITAIRFWKDAEESGLHTGNIWSATGTLLASVSFTGETPSGWQQQALPTPITITANTTYVVSVNTANSYYVVTTGGLASKVTNLSLSSVVGSNGVYSTTPGSFPTGSYQTSNYFRDVVFAPSTAIVTYSISGTITPTSSGSGATVSLSGSSSGTVTANSSGVFTFSGLSNGGYTVAATKAGVAISPSSTPVTISGANVTGVNFTATTAETIFTSQIPALVNQTDGSGDNYEAGTVFTSDIAGQITTIRFYKGTSESGTQTGKIWSSTGVLLASVVFTNETASGWQQQNLAAPLSIAANTQYTVSVNTGNAYYVTTVSGLASQIVSGDLSTVVGNNGVYGTSGQFPTSSWENSSYFRDVVFVPGS